jgi:hypothetical protein
MKVSSFQGTILLQSSFPRTRESRFVHAELAWIPAFAGMTKVNSYAGHLDHFRTGISKEVTKNAKLESINRSLRVLRGEVIFFSAAIQIG